MKVVVNNKEIEVEEGSTILEAVRKAGYNVPTLCYQKGLCETGSCRVCVCEVNGRIMSSCSNTVSEGMVIVSNSEKVIKARKTNIELLLSNHNFSCSSCGKATKCKLQKYAYQYGCEKDTFKGDEKKYEVDDSSPSIVRDNSKCILCGKCIAVCSNVQGLNVYGKGNRGFNTRIACAFDKPISDSKCVGCGQCVLACPTGALLEKSDVNRVLREISSKEQIVVAQIAPSVRVALSEEFGGAIGTIDEKKMVAALKMCGFSYVYDVNNAADFTVIEEEKELFQRIKENKNLPQFSSCCPAWFNFVNENFPMFKENVSCCKSPSEMMASIVKYIFKEQGKENVKVVSIMPCTAKKHELIRCKGADYSLTTRELASMIKLQGIDFNSITGENFDSPFEMYSGASVIFGVTGGVTEAVLRTAMFHLTGKEVEEVKEVRLQEGIKEVELKVNGLTLKVAIVSGLMNARKVCEMIASGEKSYHFVEVMACPGGCINGGGQPFVDYDNTSVSEVIAKRSKSLFVLDNKAKVKQSHNNEQVNKIYAEVFKNDEKLIKKLLHND